MSERFDLEELRGERDAETLARIARALDVSDAPGPRAEFLARLRADLERESHAPSGSAARPAQRLLPLRLALPRFSLAWAAALVLAVSGAVTFALLYPEPSAPTAITGDRVVLLSSQGFVTFDPKTLEQKEQVQAPATEPWVQLASDQRTLVFTYGPENLRTMRVYDLASAAATPRWGDVTGVGRSVRQFALSRDGTLAYVRDGNRIDVVDVRRREAVGTIPTPGIGDSPVYLAPDDRRLLQFLPEGALVVFDVAQRREVARVPVDFRDQEGLSASARVAFAPDGRQFYVVGTATASPSGPVRIEVRDTATLDRVAAADVDPAKARTLSRVGLEEALDRLAGALGFVAEAKELGTVTQIALSPDGRTLYAARGAAGSGILVVDTLRLEAVGLAETGRSVYGLQLAPDGERLFVLAAQKDEAALLSLDARSYAVVASVRPKLANAENAAIVLKP